MADGRRLGNLFIYKQVTSKNLSVHLRSAGFRNMSTEFWWVRNTNLMSFWTLHHITFFDQWWDADMFVRLPAFSTTELGLLLPEGAYTYLENGRWIARYKSIVNSKGEYISSTSEAEARGKLLVYLKENKLMEKPRAKKTRAHASVRK